MLQPLQQILKVSFIVTIPTCNSNKSITFYVVGNWSDGLREILASCYQHHGLDPETYIIKDTEDESRDRSFLPEELRPHPPPQNSPASRLLPDPRGRRLRSDGDEVEDGDEGFERQERSQKGYDPFSNEPTPLAVRRKRRK